jgi:hypothetical protein
MNELSGYAKSGRAKAGWRASEDTSRDLGVGKMKKASQKPFDGDPSRGSQEPKRLRRYMG